MPGALTLTVTEEVLDSIASDLTSIHLATVVFTKCLAELGSTLPPDSTANPRGRIGAFSRRLDMPHEEHAVDIPRKSMASLVRSTAGVGFCDPSPNFRKRASLPPLAVNQCLASRILATSQLLRSRT
eukprot:5106072-Amphidinium_carterae.1